MQLHHVTEPNVHVTTLECTKRTSSTTYLVAIAECNLHKKNTLHDANVTKHLIYETPKFPEHLLSQNVYWHMCHTEKLNQ
jgi:hypothetical protein